MAFVYSCCFWFSLRLGGILIGVFSLALLLLICCCLIYTHPQQVKDVIDVWIDTLDLGYYITILFENVKSDPEGYVSLPITYQCIYIVSCILFIYGAYTYNNTLMIVFILLEATRLIIITVLMANFLLLLKQNTMDIGLLIGASVIGGFLLLGMSYLWVCSSNLPILINEMKLDEQEETINKLEQLLDTKNKHSFINTVGNVAYASNFGLSKSRLRSTGTLCQSLSGGGR